MELYEGRPASNEGREEKEIRVYDLLDRLGIHYQRTDHEPADTMEACGRIDAILGVLICKNLFLTNRNKSRFYLLMMPGDKEFRTKELAHQHGLQRLSFASPEDMKRLIDLTPGSVSVTGLMNDPEGRVQLLVDEDVLKGEYVGCHPSMNTSSLKMKTKDLFDVFLPAVGHDPWIVKLEGKREETPAEE
ncbi:MAG: prolyl-tRNA synthetase associated domain-containing protein [Clostridia bacterium]|nr:prolyl-tRNA synthetase associated domain-containing protein [Clostridia bacterium]MBR5743455.1 prolyl-tRNA synthetase associated domain-containing protein [Clostridia bacterium]